MRLRASTGRVQRAADALACAWPLPYGPGSMVSARSPTGCILTGVALKLSETQEAIIAAAEQMFGRLGVDAVSMRAIGAAAGSGNHYSVQYHFGSKEGLIRAILLSRARTLERYRGEFLAEATAAGKLNNAHALIRALLMPMAMQTDANGRHSFASFAVHLYWHSKASASWMESHEFSPMMLHILDLLRGLVDLPPDIKEARLRNGTLYFLHVLIACDKAQETGNPQERPDEEFWTDAIGAITASYLAPLATVGN